VCTRSGLPAVGNCPETAEVTLPATLWRHRRCALHPSSQMDVGGAAARPADATRWDLSALIAAQVPRDAEEPRALGITVPAMGAKYVLSGVAGGDQLRLSTSLGEAAVLHWYADDRYLGQSGPNTPLYWGLALGEHRVTCVAEDGATDTVRFSVVRPEGGVKIE
jgi:membrane carboxypeptidase/penicillin-binding protein PbpC